MTKVSDILGYLESVAPLSLAEDWDNCGLLVGHIHAPVSTVLVCLDIFSDTITEAKRIGAELIVAHHPVTFGLKRVTDQTAEGRRILALAGSGIAAICMHTNLDTAEGGICELLAGIAGLGGELELLAQNGKPTRLGRVGTLPSPETMSAFLNKIAAGTGSRDIRVFDSGHPVHRVAVVSGSGGSMLDAVLESGCDTFVTGDIKHNLWQEARDFDLNLIDAGHFATENIICKPLAARLSAAFPELEVVVSETDKPLFTSF